MNGHEDPADQPPWAMQLVLRVEKGEPPPIWRSARPPRWPRDRLLADPRSAPGGSGTTRWRPGRTGASARWCDGPAACGGRRSATARRARGPRGGAGAGVRARPGHRGAAEISRLQVGGTDLRARRRAETPARAAVRPGRAEPRRDDDDGQGGRAVRARRAAAAARRGRLAGPARPRRGARRLEREPSPRRTWSSATAASPRSRPAR